MYRKSYYESLLKRVEILEQLYFEGAKDDLKKYLGDDLYNDYMKIRNKISDTEWKDFGKIQKKDKSSIRDYVDNFQSKSGLKAKAKEGADLIYSDGKWDVYKVKTYDAAKYYGRGTKWCITGRYDGDEEKGQYYFDLYIKNRNLDGGYYFYIAADGDKYCVLREKDGTINSIWMANDRRTTSAKIRKNRPDFPSVPNVLEFNEASDDERESIIIKAVKKCREDIKKNLDVYYKNSCVLGKPSINGDTAKFSFSVKLYLSGAEVNGTISLSYKSPTSFDLNYSFIDSDKRLNNGKGVSGTLKDLAIFEQAYEGDDEVLYDGFYDDLKIADGDL